MTACSNSRAASAPTASPTPTTSQRILDVDVLIHANVATARRSAGIEAFDNFFAPTILRGAPGAPIFLILRNGGYHTHNVTLPDLHYAKDIPPGDIRYAQARFPATGVLAFYCRFHRTSSGMIGALEADPSIPAPK